MLSLAALLAATPAFAALDDLPAAVNGEAQRLGARWRPATLAAAQPVHRLEWPDGSSLRQFVDADGRVWAVAWNTRTAPRMDLLLGPHYAAWREALGRRQTAGARHAARVTAGDLVVESRMNGNAYTGRAWLRSRAPAGQGSDALR
ncbi:MAG: DUF2844 domain-containing protein [Rubrivivax sp.]